MNNIIKPGDTVILPASSSIPATAQLEGYLMQRCPGVAFAVIVALNMTAPLIYRPDAEDDRS